ncbi:hypothetical protein COO91_09229 (plasmid) [Nostoc flagelliforme CCNUN1]|uniref:Uncharacterized protein n=1 Tax=Nostoc flagelliforme CCNUN1 TaxID=2038116 RepID=A0A2K8T5Y1_9NOSO|nr:hypothetical protein COO91_09229 [Nostoc flagelliforme CCNUN1]
MAIAALYWSYTDWFGYAEPITTGIISSLIGSNFLRIANTQMGIQNIRELIGAVAII